MLLALFLAGIPLDNLWKEGLPQSRDEPSPESYPIEKSRCSLHSERELCYEFVMVGNTTHDRDMATNIQSLSGAKGENMNDGWIAVASREDFHTWTLANKNISRVGIQMLWPLDGVYSSTLNMYNPTSNEITYVVHFNESKNCIDGYLGCEERYLNKIAAWQLIVDSALIRLLAKKEGKTPYENAEIKASMKASPHPPNNFIYFDIFGWTGKNFCLIAISFNFVVQAYQMTREKELRLPEMLKGRGGQVN